MLSVISYLKCLNDLNSNLITDCYIVESNITEDITVDDKYLTEGITFTRAWPSDDQMVKFGFSDSYVSIDFEIIPYEGKLIIVHSTLKGGYYIKNLTPKNNTLVVTWNYGEKVEDNYVAVDGVCLEKRCISSSHITCESSQYSCATEAKNCGKRYVDERTCKDRTFAECEEDEDGCYLPKCNKQGYSNECPDGQICEFIEGCQVPIKDAGSAGSSENFHIKFNFLCDDGICTKNFLTNTVLGGEIFKTARLYRNLSIDDIPNTEEGFYLHPYFQCLLSDEGNTFNGCLSTTKTTREDITEYLDEGITFTHAWPSDDQMFNLEYYDLKHDSCWNTCNGECEHCPAVELYSQLYIIPYEGKLIIVQDTDLDYHYIKILTPKNNTLYVTWNYSTKDDGFYVKVE